MFAAASMFYVHLLASKPSGTLYLGVTSDLPGRIWQHKAKAFGGFTARYGVDRLVWFEAYDSAEAAIRREKEIKQWKRDWKINLIERDNRHWIDCCPALLKGSGSDRRRHRHRPSPV